jgi:hypothetical protein
MIQNEETLSMAFKWGKRGELSKSRLSSKYNTGTEKNRQPNLIPQFSQFHCKSVTARADARHAPTADLAHNNRTSRRKRTDKQGSEEKEPHLTSPLRRGVAGRRRRRQGVVRGGDRRGFAKDSSRRARGRGDWLEK